MAESDRSKWNARYAYLAEEPASAPEDAPLPWLVTVAGQIPAGSRILDLAGGSGRHALWLAAAGHKVTLADISEVALAHAAQQAVRRGLPLETIEVDLDTTPFPASRADAGDWDVIVCTYFLWRPLLAACATHLRPGGLVLIAHPTVKNLERHPRPSAEYLLQPDELRTLCDQQAELQMVSYEETWGASGRHEAQLVARRERSLSGH